MAFVSGGRSGLLVSRSSSSSSILVCKCCLQIPNLSLTPFPTGFVYFASYTYFTSTYFDWMPNAGKCAGEEFAAFSGIAILSSYLVLFISFYAATYKKSGGQKTTRKSLRRMSQAPLPDLPHTKLVGNGNTNGRPNGATTTGAKTNSATTRSRKA